MSRIIFDNMSELEAEYPGWAMVPKKETGVTNFLTKNPSYDGRNVTIAIFDSGVDPGAPGLRVSIFTGQWKIYIKFVMTISDDI